MKQAYHQLTRLPAGFLALLLVVSLLLISWIPTTALANNSTYYVDSVSGSDSNNGLSSSAPWKTLAKVNATTYQPGDTILFKSGSVWSGQLHPLGSGTVGSPIVIDKYGTGSKPIINGDGLTGATLYFFNQQYWEINNLEVTNIAGSAGERYGVKVEAQDVGTYHHFYIKNMYIHDITGTNTDALKVTGGMLVMVSGTAVRTKWDDVLIEGNTVERADRTGISTGSSWGNNDGLGNFEPFTQLVIRGNQLNDIGGDGIVMRASIDGLIEYNVVNTAHARDTHYDAAIWPINSTRPVMQFNEAYNTKTSQDGQGFDCDYNLTGCTVQYNYSHDNEGGFLLIMGIGSIRNDNMIVRYNISQNDHTRIFQFDSSYTPLNNQIYNNTFYIGSGLSTNITTGIGGSNPLNFKNNIVYNAGSGGYIVKANDIYDYNLFYGNHPASEPADAHKITSDPLLVAPGTGGIGLSSLDGYKLGFGSPALGSGTVISSNGGRDYWGNVVSASAAPNRGAYNGPGVSNPALGVWTAVDDTTVRDGSYSGTNQSGSTATAIDVKSDATSYNREGYFKFDFSDYAGGVISEATVVLTPTATGTSGLQNTVALVSDNSWNEGTLTWNTKPSSSTVLGTYTMTSGTPVTVDITAQVQAALSAGGNKKLSLRVYSPGPVGETSYVSYASSENTDANLRPQLQITGLIASDDATVRDGTYAGSNQAGATSTTVETKNDATSYMRESYFKFNFGGYNGTVSSATITLTPTAVSATGLQNAVDLVSDNTWSESTITWNTKPASSTVLGTYTVSGGTPITINVTSQVQAAMSSGKKLSIRVYSVSPVGSNGGASYASSENSTVVQRPLLKITP
ncbi:DNRLRE domain-containing protein [Paenibacillus sp. HWE-109]|uniref:CBM96 family carbohydrate-binding protein n=1 Tax=Paenibacillus sp. HWE-109 TaxID=1306526 RepID=UPI001EDDC542|nr:DNRLRE domain-containing protein [Paenibacillus sp. HWE-109]UKS26885.1 DNRLRE domain-containing protein [Paenibacillus sp. HWE-109]